MTLGLLGGLAAMGALLAVSLAFVGSRFAASWVEVRAAQRLMASEERAHREERLEKLEEEHRRLVQRVNGMAMSREGRRR